MPDTEAEATKWPFIHLSRTHRWRQMWMFGMTSDEARRTHARLYPSCDGEATDRPACDHAFGPWPCVLPLGHEGEHSGGQT